MKLLHLLVMLYLPYIAFALQNDAGDESFDNIKRQLHKLGNSISRKMHQLKDLRSDVRELGREVKRRQQAAKTVHVSNSSFINEKFGDRTFKSRVRTKIRAMQRRLKKLEKALHTQKLNVKQLSWKKKKVVLDGMKPQSRKLTKQERTTGSVSPIESTTANIAQRNRSRPGEHNSPCSSHNECKPGHCCHRSGQEEGKCVKHAFKSGKPCRDSCSCETHLHCFREKGGNGQAYCKQAKAEDILNGTYENSKGSIFID